MLVANHNFRNIVAGTEKGLVKIYNYPLLGKSFDKFSAHAGEITNIVVSPDGKQVITAGSDGGIFVFSITEYQNEHEVFRKSGDEEE